MSKLSDSPEKTVPYPRPLSPHLQIYRPQLTSILSILHRMTGVALAVGLLMLVCWLSALASGEAAFAHLNRFYTSPLGLFLLMGWTFALYYHLANGIRHLCWDMEWGFDLKTTYLSGWIVVGVSIVGTILTLIFFFKGV